MCRHIHLAKLELRLERGTKIMRELADAAVAGCDGENRGRLAAAVGRARGWLPDEEET